MLHLFEHNWNLVWKSEANTTAFIDTVYERASFNTQAGGIHLASPRSLCAVWL